MNKETSDRVRENNSEEGVHSISPVATTSIQQNEPTTESAASTAEAEAEQTAAPRSTLQRNIDSRLSLKNFVKSFKSYLLSSEDEVHLQSALKKTHGITSSEKEPMFVIVDSSGLSNPSSKEILVDKKLNYNTDTIFAKFLSKNIIPIDLPSTSKDNTLDVFHYPPVVESVSRDELLMMDINLQSDNEIRFDEFDEKESIVVSYLRNKNIKSEMEGVLLSTKKKQSLLESVPKLETIVESELLSANSNKNDHTQEDEEQ